MSHEVITDNINPRLPPVYSHFLLVLLAAGQFALLVQEVDKGHQQQEQQNTHHHGYHHPAGASLLLVGYSADWSDTWREGWRDGWLGEGLEVGGNGEFLIWRAQR